MKNKAIILIAIAIICLMFTVYMMPKIGQRNNLDNLASVLGECNGDLPEDVVIWFVAKDISTGPPEIFYKTQFVLAPRIVKKAESLNDVPSGGKIIVVDDNSATGNELNIDSALAKNGLFSVNRDGFTVTILTKK